jgi:hypothetical protein
MPIFEQNKNTKAFVQQVLTMKDEGTIKGYSEVSTKIGFNYSAMSGVMNGRRNLPTPMWKKFLIEYQIESSKLLAAMIANEPNSQYATSNSNQVKSLPVFSWNTGFDPEFKNIEVSKSISKMCIPGFDDCDFWLEIMSGVYGPDPLSQPVVACKKTTDHDLIIWGECYLIITGETRMIRRVQKGKSDKWVKLIPCIPTQNDDGTIRHEFMDLQKNKINHIYQIIGSLHRATI